MNDLVSLMLKLGEYYEEKAKRIANYLKDAGMKVDIRAISVTQMDVIDYLEGRMSEIKEVIDEKRFERYSRYMSALRKVLSQGATPENYMEMVWLELDPQVKEKRTLANEFFEGNLTKEEREEKIPNFVELMTDLTDLSNAESFINTILERNAIQIGEEIGSRLDDPIWRIFANIDEDEDEEENKFARTTTVFNIVPQMEVLIDEYSALLIEEVDEEFEEEYSEEYDRLLLLGKLISELTQPSPGKIDIEDFADRCEFQLEREGDILDIDGSLAAEELARSLEKNGIIKVKGDTIKWRR